MDLAAAAAASLEEEDGTMDVTFLVEGGMEGSVETVRAHSQILGRFSTDLQNYENTLFSLGQSGLQVTILWTYERKVKRNSHQGNNTRGI